MYQRNNIPKPFVKSISNKSSVKAIGAGNCVTLGLCEKSVCNKSLAVSEYCSPCLCKKKFSLPRRSQQPLPKHVCALSMAPSAPASTQATFATTFLCYFSCPRGPRVDQGSLCQSINVLLLPEAPASIQATFAKAFLCHVSCTRGPRRRYNPLACHDGEDTRGERLR